MIKEALYYEKLEDNRVQCHLCPAECRLKPDRPGICRSRFNDAGRLMTNNYGETVTVAIDPIEKKPLYHFLPGTDIVSIGVNGCNLSCKNCQNWHISQEKAPTAYIAPEELPRVGAQRGSVGVAYTYTEPMIWFEYLLDAAPLVHEAGLVNVMVSNGYINPEPLGDLLPLTDAFNIDLKGMRPEFYRRICKGKLEPVLDVIRIIGASEVHLEVTNLVIPDLNDSDEDFHKLGEFLASVDKNIPVHLSAYHPDYKLDKPATSKQTLMRACEIIDQYMSYVYIGNMHIEGRADTHCPACGNTLVVRSWYQTRVTGLDDGKCRQCGRAVDLILSKT
jgi:pyruvate formate lyase activating enzyme